MIERLFYIHSMPSKEKLHILLIPERLFLIAVNRFELIKPYQCRQGMCPIGFSLLLPFVVKANIQFDSVVISSTCDVLCTINRFPSCLLPHNYPVLRRSIIFLEPQLHISRRSLIFLTHSCQKELSAIPEWYLLLWSVVC